MRLGWKLPLERLSESSLSQAIQCPEQFRQKYIVRERDSDVMFGSRFVGIVDHATNEKILRRDFPEDDRPYEIERLYMETWNEQIERHGEPDWRDDDSLKMMETGIKMAQTYHSLVRIEAIATEQRFEVKVPGVPAPIVGYIDVIERDKIRERKTTGAKTTKPKPKWRFQGLIYQFAIGMPVQWDVVTRQVTPQVYLASDHPDLFLGMANPKVTEQLIRDAARRVNDLYTQYGADHPWPMDGLFSDWGCSYCVIGPKYERTCPAWQT